MHFQSNFPDLTPDERAQYGEARAKDIAYDAVSELWRRRKSEGMRQIDIAHAIGRQPATISRNLNGPRNFTLRTLGEFVEALNGELEIVVRAIEDPLPNRPNFHAYASYEPSANFKVINSTTTPPKQFEPNMVNDASVSTVSS